jgi:type II secretory pathway pseudopilin PulG
MSPTLRPRRATAGYSLIECLLAAGLMTGVLASISGLFIVGTQSVKSGRELTKATAIGNSALEQVLGWNYDKVYAVAGGAAADRTRTWSTDLANPSFTGTTAEVAEMNAVLDDWREKVRTDLRLGKLTYRVDGLGRLPTTTDDGRVSYVDASFLRVTVTVEWIEGRNRRRQVSFEEIVL